MAVAVSEEASEKKSLKRFLVPALVGGLVVATSLAGTFGFLYFRTSETEPSEVGAFLASESAEVERTATQVVTLLSNYDATNIDDVVNQMLEITTGSFRKDYADTFEAGFGEAIKKASTSARGQIIAGPDVSFRSADEAVAVVRVTQTIQNDQNPGGRTYIDVMQITLIKTADGGWKADRVEVLGGQET
ncbi:MAG: hypothetical protein M3238_05805 [Actinomycetota bacterium]|nr:hypothetical protein [Actinomycetota bacterium]